MVKLIHRYRNIEYVCGQLFEFIKIKTYSSELITNDELTIETQILSIFEKWKADI